jgi:hypothetical protein
MSKSAYLIVRVAAALKQRIEEAARRQGMSITSFVLKAAEAAARKAESLPAAALLKPTRGKGACPTFFVAACTEAGRGGASGYRQAAWHLTGSLMSLKDYSLSDEEWHARLDRLEQLIDAGDDDGVLAWFERELPRCMALVPQRRRQQFLQGVVARVDKDHGILR